MVACVRSVAAALAMISVSFAAVAQVVPPGAQVVPPSDQPGRERERFERPPVPLAQPAGPAISVPGVEAPPGAAETKLVIRQIRIVGATIYTAAQLAELYADVVGKAVTLQAVYDLAQRITAKYGGDGYVLSRACAATRSERRRGQDPGGGRLHREGRLAAGAFHLSRLFFVLRRERGRPRWRSTTSGRCRARRQV